MKILVDENIPLARELFARFGEVVARPGRTLAEADVRDADVLLVRSVTRVDAALLAGSRVRFVGTATIGTDHVDLDWLRAQGIAFASAPGSNAMSVVDYVTSALLELADRHGITLAGRRAGIVGRGNVGGRLQARLQAMGLQVLACDPPLAEAGQTGLVELAAIADCDIVSFHTPLVREGAHPTHHLGDAALLARLRPGAIVLNTSRGAVVDNAALREALDRRDDLLAVLDVWEGEPRPDPALVARVALATPHIAGYAYDGKLRGSAMLHDALCGFLGERPGLALDALVPAAARQVIDLAALAPRRAIDLVRASYRIGEDDAALRASLRGGGGDDARAAAFDRLRRDYPLRREFAQVTLAGTAADLRAMPAAEQALARAIGFALPAAG